MATEGPVTLDGAGVASVMTQYDTVLLDCDGVLWGSNHVTPLPGESTMLRYCHAISFDQNCIGTRIIWA